MPLYTAPQGDIKPYVKYNAKAGKWMSSDEVEIKEPTFVADLENVEKAWMYYREGQAPDVIKFPDVNANVERPSENHKLGLIINLFSDKSFGGAVEFSSNSSIVCGAISDLYEQYLDGENENKGKLPVVSCKDTEAVKGQYGTNYKPIFKIEKWIARPDALASDYVAEPEKEEETVSEF